MFDEELVNQIFSEPLLQQSRRMQIQCGPAEGPGTWRDKTRKAAFLEALKQRKNNERA
jgi:hypothetical protein